MTAFRETVEESLLQSTLSISDEFSVNGLKFVLLIAQDGTRLIHWFSENVTRRLLEETLVGFAVRLRNSISGIRTVLRDNRFRYRDNIRFLRERLDIVIVPETANSNDLAAPIEHLAELIAREVGPLNSTQRMLVNVGSIVNGGGFAYLFDDLDRIPAMAALAAGGTTMAALQHGVWKDDVRFSIQASREVTEAEERACVVLTGTGVSQAEAASEFKLCRQTVRWIVAKNALGQSVVTSLDNATVLAVSQASVCYSLGKGDVAFISTEVLAPHRVFAVKCFEYIVNAKRLPGVIIGQCGDRVVVSVPPNVGTFVVEIPKAWLSAVPSDLKLLPEDSVRRVVGINTPGGATVDDAWIRGLRRCEPIILTGWTEPVVTANGNTLVCEMNGDSAIFARTGQPAQVRLDDPSGAGIANLCGTLGVSGQMVAIGDQYLLSLHGGAGLIARAAAQGAAKAAQLRSFAAQMSLAWPNRQKLRCVGWTLLAYWVVGETWHGYYSLGQDAGVTNHTAARYFEPALQAGLPWANGVVSQEEQPPWADVRRDCMLRLLAEGHAASAPALFSKVDQHAATLAKDLERNKFVFVAQAVIMQRLSERGERAELVRPELAFEGVTIGISKDELPLIIADVWKHL